MLIIITVDMVTVGVADKAGIYVLYQPAVGRRLTDRSVEFIKNKSADLHLTGSGKIGPRFTRHIAAVVIAGVLVDQRTIQTNRFGADYTLQ